MESPVTWAAVAALSVNALFTWLNSWATKRHDRRIVELELRGEADARRADDCEQAHEKAAEEIARLSGLVDRLTNEVIALKGGQERGEGHCDFGRW